MIAMINVLTPPNAIKHPAQLLIPFACGFPDTQGWVGTSGSSGWGSAPPYSELTISNLGDSTILGRKSLQTPGSSLGSHLWLVFRVKTGNSEEILSLEVNNWQETSLYFIWFKSDEDLITQGFKHSKNIQMPGNFSWIPIREITQTTRKRNIKATSVILVPLMKNPGQAGETTLGRT